MTNREQRSQNEMVDSGWMLSIALIVCFIFTPLGIWLTVAAFTWQIGWALGVWWTTFVLSKLFRLGSMLNRPPAWMPVFWVISIPVLAVHAWLILTSGAIAVGIVYSVLGALSILWSVIQYWLHHIAN